MVQGTGNNQAAERRDRVQAAIRFAASHGHAGVARAERAQDLDVAFRSLVSYSH